MDKEEKHVVLHKEIDLIQACITRMAQNSFTIKGWYFALIIVISAWKFNNSLFYGCTLFVTALIFYVLNLQFYIYERRFRELYSERIELRCEDDNYEDKLYSLIPKSEKFSMKQYFKKYIMKNKMLLFMYFGICVLLIIANLLMNKAPEDKVKIEIEIEGINHILETLDK